MRSDAAACDRLGRRIVSTCAFLLCCLFPPPVCTAATEVVVALDADDTLFVLDAETRERLELWPALHPDFEEAHLLRDEEGSFVLQIRRRDGRDFVQDRQALSSDEVEALRAQVTSALAGLSPRQDPRVGDARVPLLTVSVLAGLGFYSWGVPAAADLDGRTAFGVGMLGVGASFLVPYFATRNETVTPGMANLAATGLTRGIAYGSLLHRLVTGPRGDSDGRLGAGVAGSVTSGLAGYLWARGTQMSAGRAHLIETMGDLGLLAGVELAIAADLEAEHEETDRGMEYVATLGGAAAGLAAGAWRGADSRPTWGDAEVLRTASLLTQCIFLSAWKLGTDNPRTLAGAALGGAAVGTILGDRLTDRPDFSTSQAILLDLSTIAGGALAAGIVYLLDDDDDSANFDETEYLIGLSSGAAAGFTLAYAAFARVAMGPVVPHREETGTLDLQIRPYLRPASGGRSGFSVDGLSLSISTQF